LLSTTGGARRESEMAEVRYEKFRPLELARLARPDVYGFEASADATR
jgi:hypothetical protein